MGSSFGAGDFARLTAATNVQMADVEAYRTLLEIWNGRMNLVGPSAMLNFWDRHAWDSAQLLQIDPAAKVWADIGAGAGFPGLILSILLKQTAGAQVHLVESIAKRCRFLTEVVEALGLPATVHNLRAETAHIGGIEIVTARACAPLPRLLSYAEPFFKAGATGLFLKGQDAKAELSEAKKTWAFEADLMPSRSDASGMIVRIKGLSHAKG